MSQKSDGKRRKAGIRRLGPGNDDLRGGGGDDVLNGNEGDDVIGTTPSGGTPISGSDAMTPPGAAASRYGPREALCNRS